MASWRKQIKHGYMCTWGVYLLEQWLWERIGTETSTSAHMQVVLCCFISLGMFSTKWPLDNRCGPQHLWDFVSVFPLRNGMKSLIFLLRVIRKPWTVVKDTFPSYSHGKFSRCRGICQKTSRILFKSLRKVEATLCRNPMVRGTLVIWTQSLRKMLA